MAADLDLPALAEDVAGGRRTLDNVIDQIAVATPDDRKRRDAVAELQTLVVGLTAVKAHARATAEATAREPAAAGRALTVASGPAGPRRPVWRVGMGPVLAGGASLVAGILVLVVVIGLLRPVPSVGGPSPSIPSASPLSSAPGAVSGSATALPSGSVVPSGGSVDATTYDVFDDRAYRLLGFAPGDAQLIGYESSGEAEFWEQPVSLELATGAPVFTPLDGFPAGMHSNGNTARYLDRINPASGDVLATGGGAKGPAEWVLLHGTTETPFGLDLSSTLAWGDAATVAVMTSVDPPGSLELSTTTGPGADRVPLTSFIGPSIPSQGLAAPVALDGVHDGLVLVATGALFGRGAGGPEGVMLVDVRSGASVQLPRQQGANAPHLNFAGWIQP